MLVGAGTPLVSVPSGGVGLSSDRAVRLNDTSSRAMAVMAIAEPQGTTRNLELGLRSNYVASAFLMTLDGRRGGTFQPALHLGVFPDGSLRRWTGSRWVALFGPGLVKATGWAGVRINASLFGAWVYVNGRLFSRVPLTPGRHPSPASRSPQGAPFPWATTCSSTSSGPADLTDLGS